MADLTINNLFSVKGKVALVTGGGTGLGKMMTTALAQNGARVYIASRKLPVLQQTADEINSDPAVKASGGQVIPVKADLRTRKECEALAATMKEKETKLNILINNSGIAWGGPLLDFPEAQGWMQTFQINLFSYFYLTVSLLPLLLKEPTPTDPSRVINISSIASLSAETAQDVLAAQSGGGAEAGTYSYGVSKAAVNQLTRSMAHTFASRLITVNAIAPGRYPSKMTTQTGMDPALKALADTEQPTGRVGDAADMAGLTLLLCSRGGAHITGAIIPTAGGAELFGQPARVAGAKPGTVFGGPASRL
ncbi:hypothetical protein DFJ74DRAFT_652691 [Hyaloraphidium curvatum]|nr:hypothetical protein DFJ74DRAFT_652691 [Hyaloraphidium curvatum]